MAKVQLKGEAKLIGGRLLKTHRQRPIAPPRSTRTASEGMLISSGIMRPQRVLGRERAWGIGAGQSKRKAGLSLEGGGSKGARLNDTLIVVPRRARVYTANE